MNTQVNTKTQSAGTILVRSIRKEESGVHAPDRPYTWFERTMLEVMGTLRAQRLV